MPVQPLVSPGERPLYTRIITKMVNGCHQAAHPPASELSISAPGPRRRATAAGARNGSQAGDGSGGRQRARVGGRDSGLHAEGVSYDTAELIAERRFEVLNGPVHREWSSTTSTRVALPLGAATAAATGEAAAGFSNSASGDSAGAASSTSVTVPEFARLFAGGREIRTRGPTPMASSASASF